MCIPRFCIYQLIKPINMKNEILKEISLSKIVNYEYTKNEYSKSIEHLYKDYYPLLPKIIIIDGNYYYQRGSKFILFSKLTFDAISDKLNSVTFDENAKNELAENRKYSIRLLEIIQEVHYDLNKNNKLDL